MGRAGIILAAGKGTRMKSAKPKALHEVAGIPMIRLVIRACRDAGVARPTVVIGHGAEAMREVLAEDDVTVAVQSEQLGTGHATLMARDALADYTGPVLVTAGDTPLLTSEAINHLFSHFESCQTGVAVATFRATDPTGYGRVIRDSQGALVRIVEQRDASTAESEIQEVNSGVYVFDAKSLFEMLPTLGTSNAQGEFYLTDILTLASERELPTTAVCFEDPNLFFGVNDRWQLAEATRLLNQRTLKHLALAGVTISDPATTFVSPWTEVGEDTVLEPMTVIVGETVVGTRCTIGPSTRLESVRVGDGTSILMSHVKEAQIGRDCKVGPFAHLRPKACLADGVRIGNFVEVKNATLGERAQANHLAYIGDASVGPMTNVGAGTITCNFDGYSKHVTTIGEGCFIGSNSTLVAPVTVGDGAYIAAGSTITEDVSAAALALGRARQTEKEGWAKRWREKNSKTDSTT